jgi:hypothetical protein
LVSLCQGLCLPACPPPVPDNFFRLGQKELVLLSKASLSVFLIALVLGCALLGALRFNSFPVGAYQDDAEYIILAKSLATGQGYHLINYPADAGPRPDFLPGWPILLVPLTILFPGQYQVLKLAPFFFYLASIPLIYGLFVDRIGKPFLLLSVAIAALNPVLLGMSGILTSEVAYLFFSLLALWLFLKWTAAYPSRPKYWLLGLALLAALYAQLVRPTGLALLLSILVCLLLARPLRRVGIVISLGSVAVLVGLAAWQGPTLVTAGYPRHAAYILAHFADLVQVWKRPGAFGPILPANLLLPGLEGMVGPKLAQLGLGLAPAFFSLAVLAVTGTGLYITLRAHRDTVILLYIFFYLAILVLWISYVGFTELRLFIPLIPLLSLYLLLGLEWILQRLPWGTAAHKLLLYQVVLTSVVAFFVVANVVAWLTPISARISDPSAGWTWLRGVASEDAIVMTRDPMPAYLYLQHWTVDYPASAAEIQADIARKGVNFIVIAPKLAATTAATLDAFTGQYFLPYLDAHPDDFQRIYEDPAHNVAIYRVKRAA